MTLRFNTSVQTTLNSAQSFLLARLIKDNGHWDGCDDVLTMDRNYCQGCKYQDYCRNLRKEFDKAKDKV